MSLFYPTICFLLFLLFKSKLQVFVMTKAISNRDFSIQGSAIIVRTQAPNFVSHGSIPPPLNTIRGN